MGWPLVKLGDICRIELGKTPSRGDASLWDKEKSGSNIWLSIADLPLTGKPVMWDSKEYISQKGANLCKVIPAGTLMVSFKLSLGRLAYAGTDLFSNEAIASLYFGDNVEIAKDYLFWVLTGFDWDKAVGSDVKVKGKTLNKAKLKEIRIPLPPIPEQRRIVAILDQAFADIENLNQVFSQRGEGWEEKPWGALCSFVRGPFGGSLKKSMFKESGYSVFEQKHAIHDHIEQFRYFIDEDKFIEMKRFEVKPGEMIMSCSGVTLGRVSVIPNGAPQGIINQALLKLTAKNGTDIHFIKYWIKSPIFQEIIFKHSGGAAQPNVPAAKQLKQITLSIPNIAQQNIVVNEIQSFLQTNRGLIKVYENKIKSLDELKKSLLQKAFSGELTKTEGMVA